MTSQNELSKRRGPEAPGGIPACGNPRLEAEPPGRAGRTREPLLRSVPAVYVALVLLSPEHSRPNSTPDSGPRSPLVTRAGPGGRRLVTVASCLAQPNLSRCVRRGREEPVGTRLPGRALPPRRPHSPQHFRGQPGGARPGAGTRAPTPTPAATRAASLSGGTKGARRRRQQARGGGSGRGRKVGEEAWLAEGTGRASAGRAAHAAVNGRLAGRGGGRAVREFQELAERAAAGVTQRPDSGPRRSCRRRRRAVAQS